MKQISDYGSITPETVRNLPNDDLLNLLDRGVERTIADWIRDELQRRHLCNIADQTKELIAATSQVHDEVSVLAHSSERLETLTRRLNRLTWVLIILTALAVIVPIGIEAWKVSREPQTAPATMPP